MPVLHVFLDSQIIGAVTQAKGGRLSFRYDEGWLANPASYPLSLSMPLALPEHGSRFIGNFMWGLLPDNDLTIRRWADRFQVSRQNPFALLTHVGEDCAGAVQFLTPERLDTAGNPGTVEWITIDDIRERLKALNADVGATRKPSDNGEFSLAGAQRKIALFRDGNRWGIPSGRMPTTHIIKPQIPGFAGHTTNEHFSLKLAETLGLAAARSEIIDFGDGPVIVVERYDRIQQDGEWRRIHQEDFCQALGLHPMYKYQSPDSSAGKPGPGVREIGTVIKHSTNEKLDTTRLFHALIFNFLIGGTDAHAKNYSILHGTNGNEAIVRFAPVYDLASYFPYKGDDSREIKMPMKIGEEYRLNRIKMADWIAAGARIGLTSDEAEQEVRRMTARIADAASSTATQCRKEGLNDPVLDTLVDEISRWSAICADRFAVKSAP